MRKLNKLNRITRRVFKKRKRGCLFTKWNCQGIGILLDIRGRLTIAGIRSKVDLLWKMTCEIDELLRRELIWENKLLFSRIQYTTYSIRERDVDSIEKLINERYQGERVTKLGNLLWQ